MDAMNLMLTIWGVLIAGFTALMVYRGQLTRHTTDELFLGESGFDKRQIEHEVLVRRAERIRPLVNGLGGAAAVTTVLIVGLVVARALPYVHF